VLDSEQAHNYGTVNTVIQKPSPKDSSLHREDSDSEAFVTEVYQGAQGGRANQLNDLFSGKKPQN